MKIKGKTISGANEIIIPIPRACGEDIVFRAKAVLDMEPFEIMCPPPLPPKKIFPGGREVVNLKDKNYLKTLGQYSKKRLTWMVLTSLQVTEDLEWETVDMADPTTWENFRTELQDSGFSNVEINRIVVDCIEVNALDDAKIEEARERFLLEAQEQQEESTSPEEEE